MSDADRKLVLVLGAGINGCSVARELALNGVDVWLVDTHDISYGATSKSSRLIHGGLRYLEYGDFRLVRESLEERARLRKLASHLVEPLRLYIPVRDRFGGLVQSALRFLGVTRTRWLARLLAPLLRASSRGLWTVRIGLGLYDRFANDVSTPKASLHRPGDAGTPAVDAARYQWLLGYSDAQMRYPERYCVALLDDARTIAVETSIDFRLFTYAEVQLDGDVARIIGTTSRNFLAECRPTLIVNATGSWGDFTLERLHIPADKLFGGTKGSHIVTHRRELREAIGDAGVYAEADDGRLVFILPFGEAVLIGTTDERFERPPDEAVADAKEVAYLIELVNEIFPRIALCAEDVTLTYSGVRPLPRAKQKSEAAVTRDHFIAESTHDGRPVLTLVGGKLTTSRAFGELVVDRILPRLGMVRTAMTVSRYLPGAVRDGQDVPALRSELSRRFQLEPAQVSAMWQLVGGGIECIFASLPAIDDPRRNVAGTSLPRAFVRWVIDQEWVTSLEDLVERRLMLVYAKDLSHRTLSELTELLVASGRITESDGNLTVERTVRRLNEAFTRTI